MYEYAAQGITSARDPLGVVDGDTLSARVDLGFSVGISTILRMAGINAPELSTAAGRDAKAWAIGWYQSHCPDGQFTINTIKDKTEKYGRMLAMVTAPDGAVFNSDAVSSGHAVVYNPR